MHTCYAYQLVFELVSLFVLQFQDVKYKIAAKGVKSSTARCLLQGITGSVNPGEILALMGPSGGGKTTLLNVLSGRAKLNGGTVTYNDQPYTKSLKQRYILQFKCCFARQYSSACYFVRQIKILIFL